MSSQVNNLNIGEPSRSGQELISLARRKSMRLTQLLEHIEKKMESVGVAPRPVDLDSNSQFPPLTGTLPESTTQTGGIGVGCRTYANAAERKISNLLTNANTRPNFSQTSAPKTTTSSAGAQAESRPWAYDLYDPLWRLLQWMSSLSQIMSEFSEAGQILGEFSARARTAAGSLDNSSVEAHHNLEQLGSHPDSTNAGSVRAILEDMIRPIIQSGQDSDPSSVDTSRNPRGRGRPRKFPKILDDSPNAGSSSSEVSRTPRRRGRPRKFPKITDSPITGRIPRGVGRPRKVPKILQDSSVTEGNRIRRKPGRPRKIPKIREDLAEIAESRSPSIVTLNSETDENESTSSRSSSSSDGEQRTSGLKRLRSLRLKGRTGGRKESNYDLRHGSGGVDYGKFFESD